MHLAKSVALFLCAVFTVGSVSADERIFRDRIAGLLRENCLSCHNTSDRKGRLSLESAETLQAGGESGPVIVAGNADLSYLLDMVTPVDGRAAMPKGGTPLADDDLQALRQWINRGAVWPEDVQLQPEVWWSRLPLERPHVPQAESSETFPIRSPVDAFVLEKLNEQGLSPSPAADRRTLARRLYFDLTGLPPTPEQLDEFVHDPDPLAYERLVDELLASPRYGERQARYWLDVVQFADTCGYDKDKLRPHAWPYRDYVIRSFNDDKPYARFVQEQIAGDVLFPGDPDGILGLGFIAAGPWDFIGHVEVPESKFDGKVARDLDRDNMVTNTLNTFCSVTIQCARCHDHKFDPFTQEHYFSLQSVFAAVDRAERSYDLDPGIERRRRELDRDVRRAREELAALDREIRQDGGDELSGIEMRLQELKPLLTPSEKRPEFGYHSTLVSTQEAIKWVQIDLGEPVEITKLVLRPCHDDYAGIGAGFGFPVRFRVTAANEQSVNGELPGEMTIEDRTDRDVPNPGLLPVEIDAGGMTARYIRIMATRLAERRNDYLFALAELQVFDRNGNNVAIQRPVTSLDSIEAPVRWRRSNLTDGIWAVPRDEQAVREAAELQQRQATIRQRIETPDRVERRQVLGNRIQQLETELKSLPAGRMVYAAATDFAPQGSFRPTRGQPRPIHVLHRGNVNDPGEAVRPGSLPIIPGEDWRFRLDEKHSEGDRRAALAAWLVREDNPLTWRSMVNRIWQSHFGKGLVETPNDFGRMGKMPTHPELLDWLAVEFRDGGQSFKNLHRLLVTSSVYRQASTHDERKSAIDGENSFLWRMPRRRLEAEEIRDSILAVSGRLNLRMGGPGFYLFVLEKTEHSPHYEYHKFDPADPASHRRSVYRFVVRSQPDPYMTTLDCADSSQSTPKRTETVTALQALSLLNNRFNLVMSQAFAERLRKERPDLPAQVARGMQLTVGRLPDPQEQWELEVYAGEHGLANLCRVLLNLNEFVYLD